MIVKIQQEDFVTQNEINNLKNRCKETPGAIISFVGYVRDYSNNEEITSLDIENYPGMTEKKLMEISEEASKKWPLLGSLVIHRYGQLNTSDQIVLVAVASLHRKAAFQATEFMMDYLKTSAPFWKSEIINNSKVWVKAKLEDEIAKKKWQ